MKFRTKTILGIGLIETVLLIILVISSISFLNRSNDEQILNRATTTADLFAAATKDAVLSTDLDSLQGFVDELLTKKDIVYVRILGDGIILAQGGNKQALQRTFSADSSLQTITDHTFDTSAIIQEAGYEFGRIELGLSVAATTQLIAEAWKWASGIATLEILLVAFFSFMLGTYLTGQLNQLTVAAEAISTQGPGYQIHVKGNDEIARVSQSFNQMSRNLSDSYQQLNTSASEYRNLAERLAESDAKKSSMLSSALDAIITIDSNGVIEEFNASAEKVFGYSIHEAVGKSMHELIMPEEFHAAHHKGMEHWKATGEGPYLGQRIETRAARKNGEIFPIELSITQVKVNGETIFTAFIRDITHRKATESELRMAASTFDAQEGIFITNQNSIIIRVNNAFSEITGFSHDEAIGAKPAELFKSGKHDEAFYKAMWQQLQKNGRWEGEIYNQRKNGEIYPQWLGITAIRDSDDEIVNYVAHFIDISERKKFEEDLVSSRSKAESANIAKSQFLAAMSHEIRTPLNGVIGMTELLLKSELQPKQQHMLRTASYSAHILLDIIKNILDYSKIESGELTLESIPVSLNTIIEETCEILAPAAQQKQVKMILFIHPSINKKVLADPIRLQQILFNLSSNAIKFTSTDITREGRFILKVEPVKTKPGSDELSIRFSFEDNGVGIRKEKLKSIFEPFMQAELSTTRQFGGSGLGLSITKRIIEAMHGKIEVESLYGNGTHFIVDLPFKLAENQASIEQSLTDIKILVVEAFSPLDKYIQDYLRQLNAEVTLIRGLNSAHEDALQAQQNGNPYNVIVVGTAWQQNRQSAWTKTLKKLLDPEQTQFILLRNLSGQPDQVEPGICYVNAFPLLPTDLIREVLVATRPLSENSDGPRSKLEPSGQAGKVNPHVRILLVEDNEINQDVIKLQLMEIGYRTDIAADGVEALEMFTRSTYDLVLTDCHMPNMDGYELTRQIRQLKAPKGKVPVIAISANSIGTEDDYWSQVGMNEYLTKPLKVDDLEQLLAKYIQPAEATDSAQKTVDVAQQELNAEPSTVIFDDGALKKMVGNATPDVRKKLLNKFLHTTTRSMELLVAGCKQKDYMSLQRESHKLKSSAKAIGAYKLSETCHLLETACKQNDHALVGQLAENIQQHFIEVSGQILNKISISP